MVPMKFVLVLYFLCNLVYVIKCSKILAIFPMVSKSHHILGSAYLRGLAKRGHDVTMISPYKEKKALEKGSNIGSYRDIQLAGFEEEWDREKKVNMFKMINIHPALMMVMMNTMCGQMTNKTFGHPNVQKLLKSGEKFDLIVMEQFVNDAHQYFALHFDAPIIIFSTVGANQWVNHLVGNPSPPSAVADLFLTFSNHMSFLERVENTLFYVFSQFNTHMLLFPKQQQILNEHFPNAPKLKNFIYNASLVLLNSHPSLSAPVALVPNMVEIGGFHISPPKQLPKDLEDFLNTAKEGVIYFSMGSNLKSKDLPIEKRDALLKTFAGLKQKVLWKWEDDVLPGQPPNVKLEKWLPQQDILAHPNVKMFMTHGGLLSTTETVYFGKPILAIPVFGDQKLNAANAVKLGYGYMVPYQSVTQDTLTNGIKEVLENPKYQENAKLRSNLLHDTPMKPMDTAIFWTEYVIRHKGASHLRVAALDLSWYQYLLLDVIAFLVSTIALGLYILIKLVKTICCRKKCKTEKQTQKKVKKS